MTATWGSREYDTAYPTNIFYLELSINRFQFLNLTTEEEITAIAHQFRSGKAADLIY